MNKSVVSCDWVGRCRRSSKKKVKVVFNGLANLAIRNKSHNKSH